MKKKNGRTRLSHFSVRGVLVTWCVVCSKVLIFLERLFWVKSEVEGYGLEAESESADGRQRIWLINTNRSEFGVWAIFGYLSRSVVSVVVVAVESWTPKRLPKELVRVVSVAGGKCSCYCCCCYNCFQIKKRTIECCWWSQWLRWWWWWWQSPHSVFSRHYGELDFLSVCLASSGCKLSTMIWR